MFDMLYCTEQFLRFLFYLISKNVFYNATLFRRTFIFSINVFILSLSNAIALFVGKIKFYFVFGVVSPKNLKKKIVSSVIP